MNYTVNKVSDVTIRFDVTASAAEVDSAISQHGEIARNVLANELINAIFEKENISPLTLCRFEGGDMQAGQDFPFSATFDILPEIQVPDLSALEVRIPRPEVTTDDINAFFSARLSQYAMPQTLDDDRPALEGEWIVADIDAVSHGVVVKGMEARDVNLCIDENCKKNMPEIHDLALTLKVGDKGKAMIICPDTFPEEQFRGKPVEVTLFIKTIFKLAVPDFNDDFAKKLGFQKRTELEKAWLQDTVIAKTQSIRMNAQQSILNQLLSVMKFPLPQILVEDFYTELMERNIASMRQQGVKDEDIQKAINENTETIANHARQQAATHCLLLTVANQEGLTVSEEEFERAVNDMVDEAHREEFRRNIRANGHESDFRKRLLGSKALDWLFNKAKKITVVPTDDIEKQQ